MFFVTDTLPVYRAKEGAACVICGAAIPPGQLARWLSFEDGVHLACYDKEEAYWEAQHGPVVTVQAAK